jgi:hypothetical protein
MIELIPALLIFVIEVILLLQWNKSRKSKDGKEVKICFYGFLLGQLYLLCEVWYVSQTGKPLAGSEDQKMLMGRLVLGTSLGGIFTIIGLFYLSFALFTKNK